LIVIFSEVKLWTKNLGSFSVGDNLVKTAVRTTGVL